MVTPSTLEPSDSAIETVDNYKERQFDFHCTALGLMRSDRKYNSISEKFDTNHNHVCYKYWHPKSFQEADNYPSIGLYLISMEIDTNAELCTIAFPNSKKSLAKLR